LLVLDFYIQLSYEQKGNVKAEYGTKLLDNLSKDLKSQFGKGFSRRNVLDMRRFYAAYPKWQTLSAEKRRIRSRSKKNDNMKQFNN